MTESVVTQQYVTFSLAGELFAIEVSRAREVLDLVPITRIPQAADYLLGVINLRGGVVPILDLRRKLGMGEVAKTKDGCIIVLEIYCDGETVIAGALADQVQEVIDLRSDRIDPAPRLGSKLRTDFIRGIGRIDEQFLILLDIDTVFSSEEIGLAGSLLCEESNAMGA